MAAPVWNGVELDAVRELHLVLLIETAAFDNLFFFSSPFFLDASPLEVDGGVIDKLNIVIR